MDNADLSRREFLGVAAATAGGLMLAGCDHEDPYALQKPAVPGADSWAKGEQKWVATACAQCPAGCGVRVRVVEGRAVKVEGHPACPINRGGIGPRGLAGPQTLYDPDRIRQPLRRIGPRGSGRWEPISWDDAIDQLAARLQALRDSSKPHRLAIVCGKERGLMLELWQRFARSFGTPNLFDGFSTGNGATAQAVYLMQGIRELPAYDWTQTRYVLSLGSSILGSSCQLLYFARARAHLRRGHTGLRAKIVHAGPCMSRTAMNADEWLPALPGTYAALALAIAHVLVREQWYDRAFVEQHSFGFETWRDDQGKRHRGFRDLLQDYTPTAAAGICQVPADVIERIAREIAEQRPAFAVTDPQATLAPNGLQTALAVHALNALLGAIDRPGGILVQRAPPLGRWPQVKLDETATNGLNQPRLDGAGQDRFPFATSVLDALPAAVLSGKPYPVDALLLYYSNPLHARLEPARWSRALDQVPFIVTFSPYMDETAAEAADLILPDHTYLERWEDAAPAPSVGYPVFGIRQPVVAPLHQTRNTGDVVITLARKLNPGIAQAFPWKTFKQALLRRTFGIYKSKRGSIVEKKGSRFLRKLCRQGFWSDPPYRYGQWEQVLQTPSGKFEFFSQRMRQRLHEIAAAAGRPVSQILQTWGIAETPDEICMPRHVDIRWHGDPARYHLLLLPYKPNTYAEGSGANLPWLQELVAYSGRPTWTTEAEIHQETAEEAGIQDGDRIVVESPVGRIEVPVHVNAGVIRGVLRIPQGGGHTAFGRWAKGWGANVMRLLSASAIDGLSGVSPVCATRVAIRRASS